jgi:hypothetical protein
MYACDKTVENHGCNHTSVEDITNYLGDPEFVYLHNDVSFDNRYYE